MRAEGIDAIKLLYERLVDICAKGGKREGVIIVVDIPLELL